MVTYRAVLRHSDEGCSVSRPGLPGCWSQGATEEEVSLTFALPFASMLM